MYGLYDLPEARRANVRVFGPNTVTLGTNYVTYQRPPGASMLHILAVGAGGAGGSGAVGANSTAAGGGGGGSGAQSTLIIPAHLLPRTLFVSVAHGLNAAGVASTVAAYPQNANSNRVIYASGGGVGGNASGATAGAAGAAGAVGTLTLAPLAALGVVTFLAGQAGIIGGVAVNGAALTLPTTGLCVTGGTGGGGLPAAAAAGTLGGVFTVSGSLFKPHAGIFNAATATSPPSAGANGVNRVSDELFYNYGGTGGGSSHGSATGAGLFGGLGGNGGTGCGGGGGGGALTGSVQGLGGRGGDGIVIITAW